MDWANTPEWRARIARSQQPLDLGRPPLDDPILVSPLDEGTINLIASNVHAGTPIRLPDAITQEDRDA